MPRTAKATALAPPKTVFILGAGFSIPAGAPSQAGILPEIFDLPETIDRTAKAKRALLEFLTNDLNTSPSALQDIALEDIYTPIDRAIADNSSFRARSHADLTSLRSELEYLISLAIEAATRRNLRSTPRRADYIRDFAEHVVHIAARRGELAREGSTAEHSKRYDPLSIISLNWDILLDNALHKALLADNPAQGDYDPFGVVDYCCYISSLNPNDTRVRAGLWSLGCKGFNVKLLKLHGSMNWLQCPNCQRLFVGFGPKLRFLDRTGRENCRHCQRNGTPNTLRGSLVMPTFLKDLSNFQIKLVWQNAGVELREARRLVFIGYSLPYADFEFRQLLSRTIHPSAAIDVVLYEGDSEPSRATYAAEEDRYRKFLSGHALNFHNRGVVDYIAQL
jgi:hypothetical protein